MSYGSKPAPLHHATSHATPLGMQSRIRTNLVGFKLARNLHEFVDPLEFEFPPKFLKCL